MVVIKNLGINIEQCIEHRSRKDTQAPNKRKDTFEKQAKKDFEYYAKPATRRHPNYR